MGFHRGVILFGMSMYPLDAYPPLDSAKKKLHQLIKL